MEDRIRREVYARWQTSKSALPDKAYRDKSSGPENDRSAEYRNDEYGSNARATMRGRANMRQKRPSPLRKGQEIRVLPHTTTVDRSCYRDRLELRDTWHWC